MIYIYQFNERWVTNRKNAPQGIEYIELQRMIPTPVKSGFDATLNADLKTGKVWFDLVENMEGVRARKIKEIEAHDTSAAVNRFSVAGVPMWLDRDTRTSLARTIEIEKASGAEIFRMWNDSTPPIPFDLPIDIVPQLLAALEVYAKDAYNITQSHKAALYKLDNVEAIEAYDYTAGYPDQLEFNLQTLTK